MNFNPINIKTYFCVFLLFFFTVFLTSLLAENTVTTIDRLKYIPDIDGIIDSDPAWKDVPWNKGKFYLLNSSNEAKLQSKFKIGYTGKGLYLAVHCDEPQPGNIIAEKGDMEEIWNDDSLEIWLGAGKSRKVQLLINSAGARINVDNKNMSEWPVATFIGDDFWSVEAFIPYGTLIPHEGFTQIVNNSWHIGICRNIKTLKSPRFTSWCLSPPAKSYADLLPIRFSNSLSEQEKKEVFSLIAATKKSLMAVVYPGKGFGLQEGGAAVDLLLMSQGSGIMPRISPDKTVVYYNSTYGGRNGIWKIDLADKKTVRICDGSQSSCSVDGTTIVFQRDGKIISRLLKDGTEKTISPQSWDSCLSPDYLPDGKIVFIVSGTPDRMYLASSDKQPELLLSGELGNSLRCSPDGKMIAYQDGLHIWLYDIAARNSRQLTFMNGIQRYPSWTKDSKNIIFSQLFDQFNPIGDVYIQDILGEKIERITQGVDAFPDFIGEWKFAKNAESLPARPVIQVSPEDTSNTKEIVVNNGNSVMSISCANNRIQWQLKGSLAPPLQIIPLDLKGLPFAGIDSVKLTKQDNSEVICRAKLSGNDSSEIIITIKAGVLALKIDVAGAISSVDLRYKFQMVVGSDRHAWDLLYLPVETTRYPITTAYFPLMIMFPESKNHLFMAMAPGKDIQLLKGETSASFGGVNVSLGKNSRDFFIMALSHKDIWGEINPVKAGMTAEGATAAKQDSLPLSGISKETTSVKCSIPAALQWRYIIANQQGDNYSGMFPTNAAANNFELKLPLLQTAQGISSSFYYPYDRVKSTPLQMSTPMDLIISTIGFKNTEQVFDIEGIRTIKIAKPDCFYKDYRIILNWFKRININQTCSADAVCRMADDLSAMFKDILNRNANYQEFFASLEQLKDLPEDKFVLQIDDIIKASKKFKANPDSLKQFDTAITKFIKTVKELKAEQEKNIFSNISQKLFEQETSNIQQCRLLAKQIRMFLGQMVVVSPENKAYYEKFRNDCRKLLLYPVYNENMNEDENIINPEVANYEKTK